MGNQLNSRSIYITIAYTFVRLMIFVVVLKCIFSYNIKVVQKIRYRYRGVYLGGKATRIRLEEVLY